MNRKVSVIGLGYVGLPVAVAFGKKSSVIAFDINKKRIKSLKEGYDFTQEISEDELKKANLNLTDSIEELKKADFHIVAVPTPIDNSKKPDLMPLIKASETVGKAIKKGDIVVYESTVYPGATEEDCLSILEKVSGLKAGDDFHLGYSPERINPGDKEHTFTKILKIVAGQTSEICDIIAEVYSSVVEAGVYKASSIKVAEAAKVIENTQRDLSIAFVNELSKIFHLMDIDTQEVLEAASTKWNFTKHNPGLVGGHCIGIDPYYLTYKAEKLGYHPEVLLAGRRINDGMSKYVAEQVIKQMIKSGLSINNAKVALFGITFKENCPDIRNSKVFDLINELKEYHLDIDIYDELTDKLEVEKHYNIKLCDESKVQNKKYDVCIVATPHIKYVKEFKFPEHKIFIDVKSAFPKNMSKFRL
ncbi:GDP-mannose dehydrogenase [Paraphotobacterium marinum]|uniref:GDP-mannose dehydrogenase n=1 Tax=Paraphotobacterium marinum TaxID=1755811 RepID=A0A220VCP5_9GAMM|nr:nucleotide sugar dehydrogenase [Paraphotobacterium marinum]ASK78070.1 GDP-mannose dehydrogenase [Paraphotobacterium marinum]